VAWLEKRYEETGNKGYLYEELDVDLARNTLVCSGADDAGGGAWAKGADDAGERLGEGC
jgi:hypothetical protein